ncbi:MAG: peroxiredoxin family protein [Nitrososphaerales archaeon]|nr:peroxiredoxin family protein [Nitrososphaerales archaeon]
MARQRKSLRKRSHGTRNALIVVTLFVAAIAAIVYVAGQANGGNSAMLVAGAKAPEFTLTSVNGSSFNLTDYLGKTDVLLFFNEGLTCSPCLQQMVDIDRNYSVFSKMGITVASITTNSMFDMRTWAQNNGITRMMVLPDQSLQVDREYTTLYAGSMHSGSAPGHTFILVGKDGSVLWRKDYGSYTMYVPMNELIASVKAALG